MNIRILFMVVVVLLSGCEQLPEDYIKGLDKDGITKDGILKEIDEQSKLDNVSRLMALYNYAFSKGYLDIAFKGWDETDSYRRGLFISYSAKDVLVDSVFKESPSSAHYHYGDALRLGLGYPKDDFNALNHFIISALMGNELALSKMHEIYKEYNCSFQVA